MFFTPVVRTRAAAATRPSFDRSFERFVQEALLDAPTQRRLQLQEGEKAWTVSLDVPGVSREDLSISVEGPVLRIETRAEAKRAYKAAYELPQDIDADATEAKLENGVLTLTLGKLQPASRARQVTVN
jgi:HSP20 family protein